MPSPIWIFRACDAKMYEITTTSEKYAVARIHFDLVLIFELGRFFFSMRIGGVVRFDYRLRPSSIHKLNPRSFDCHALEIYGIQGHLRFYESHCNRAFLRQKRRGALITSKINSGQSFRSSIIHIGTRINDIECSHFYSNCNTTGKDILLHYKHVAHIIDYS